MFLADEGDALDNRGRAGGDYRGVDGILAVVLPVLLDVTVENADAPDSAHEGRRRSGDAEDVSMSVRGEREAFGKPFRDFPGHVAGVVQVSADEGIDVIREVIFLQLREFRGIVVLRLLPASPDIHADAEFIPVRRGALARGHPLVGRPVRLVPVRFRQDENPVGLRVVAGTGKREDVVDLDIAPLRQHATEINALTRVGVLAALLVVESDFLQIPSPDMV